MKTFQERKNKKICQSFLSRISYIHIDEINEFFQLAELPPHLIKSKFYDNDFPPEYHSLENPKNKKPLLKKNDIVWKRLEESFDMTTNTPFIFKKFQVGEFSRIYQGVFSKNVYLLIAFGMLQFYNKKIIERLFLTDQYNTYGCYGILLNYNGEWCVVSLDDFFPFIKTKNQLLFSRSEKNEIWLMLLEKAFAKLYGSYEHIQNGNLLDAVCDLTGVNYEYINEAKFPSGDEMIKKLILFHELRKKLIDFH